MYDISARRVVLVYTFCVYILRTFVFSFYLYVFFFVNSYPFSSSHRRLSYRHTNPLRSSTGIISLLCLCAESLRPQQAQLYFGYPNNLINFRQNTVFSFVVYLKSIIIIAIIITFINRVRYIRFTSSANFTNFNLYL